MTAFGKLIGMLSLAELQVLGVGVMCGVQGAPYLGCQKMRQKCKKNVCFFVSDKDVRSMLHLLKPIFMDIISGLMVIHILKYWIHRISYRGCRGHIYRVRFSINLG